MRCTRTWLVLLIGCFVPQSALPSAPNDLQTPVPLATPQAVSTNPEEVRIRDQTNAFLHEWEQQSQKLTSLKIVFERTDRSNAWGDQVFQGQACFKSPNLACVEFKRAIPGPDGKPKMKIDGGGRPVLEVEPQPFQRLVWNNLDLLRYEWDERAIYSYSLAVLAKGPYLFWGHLMKPLMDIPYLTQINAVRIKERFDIRLLPVDDPQVNLAELKPRNSSDKTRFARVLIWLDKTTFLPTRATLFPVSDKERQDFKVLSYAINPQIDDTYFRSKTDVVGWKLNRFGGSSVQPN